MNVFFRALPYFLVSFFLALIITPVAKRVGFFLKIYAIENKRTVHHGRIVRIGGLAIFLAYILSMAAFMKADSTLNAIMIGSLIIFLGGFIDDMFDLRPIVKLGFEIVAALYVIFFGGIELGNLTFGILTIKSPIVSFVISFFWIVGVSNAINLMDGLDGLAAGNSLIMIGVIGVISYFMNRIDISIMCLILAGSIAGFLPYNFHPASVFMGDCGALFLGFTIACYSLLGFKTTAFITLGFPIIILFVPLSDTTLAIIRRKASGHRISEADRSHLHHVLMYKIGLSHRNTVLLLYLVCALFGLDAVLMYFHPFWAWIMLFVLCMVAWIFIELTGMINPNFHPIIGLLRRTIGYPRKSENAFFEANKLVHATADPPKREEENES